MIKYRDDLPQLSEGLFLTDGGIETTLIFHDGLELPGFAAFDLFRYEQGRECLDRYFRRNASIAANYEAGFILESPTWRANTDWGEQLGYCSNELAEINREAIRLLVDIRGEYENEKTRMVISGCIGPRGDGYSPSDMMTEQEAERYHTIQVATFSETEADMVSAHTMSYVEEVIGIVRAAASAEMPVVISFTVETDGRLPSGMSLKDAIEKVDESANRIPAYYMINCAHPTHFENVLAADEAWSKRIRGIRANASVKSHAELDEAEELDDGNPVELAGQYRQLRSRLSNLNILGGCCGTDYRHVEEICKACVPMFVQS
ncbi:MAG: homocysteine S-methyltransferase family protein [Planctomycetes bacterium]|nr:homocysteine S-methyltransferase family protein [Planctomycetota bacterium]